MTMHLRILALIIFSFVWSVSAQAKLIILNSHLTGELNSLKAIGRLIDPDIQVVDVERLPLLDEIPDTILHALSNPEEVSQLREFKMDHRKVRLINLGDPVAHRNIFDAIIYAGHVVTSSGPVDIVVDSVPSQKNWTEVIKQMQLFKTEFQNLKPVKIAVMIGGDAKASRFTEKHAAMLANQLNLLKQKYGASLLITNSRRTSAEANQAFLKGLQLDSTDFFYDAHGENKKNPIDAMLGVADYVVVTGDSMSMVSDSLHLGKPTYVYAPEGSLEERHKRFVLKHFARGRVRALGSSLEKYSYEPIDSVAEILVKLESKLGWKMTPICSKVLLH